MIRTRKRGPLAGGPDSNKLDALSMVRRRQDAAQRLEPLECGRRDPLLHVEDSGVLCLFPAEARAEASRLLAAGWQLWEIRARFGLVWKGGAK